MESDKRGESIKELNKIDSVKNEEINKNINANRVRVDSQCEKQPFCTNDMKKNISIFLILLFGLIFLLSSACFIIITFTNRFNEKIVNHLVLRNGSQALEWWIDSPIKPLLKVHLFNYTNIDAVLAGREKKIKVVDVGPFVYEETLQRTKLSYEDGNKITFYENRTQQYRTDLTPSHLNENDTLILPNVPLILAINAVSKDPGKKLLLRTLMSTTSPNEFNAKKAREFIWGYRDGLVSGIALSVKDFSEEKVGMMGGRKGISTDNLTIYTGEDLLENFGKVHAMNGVTNVTMWDTDECNEIRGTDGTQFSLEDLASENKLQIYPKSICRTFNMEYEKEVTALDGIPAKRYIPEPNQFGSSRTMPSNKCYCDAETNSKCPPDGVFDAEKCMGVSLLMSYPHFFEGDPILLEPFEGIKPNEEEHFTFVDVHPRMAFPIGGSFRMQINARVNKFTYGIFSQRTLYKNLPSDLILPLCWFEITSGEVPPELLTMVSTTTHQANELYSAIQFGSIICMFVSFLLTIGTTLIYYKRIVGESNGKMKCQVLISMMSTHPTNSQAQNIYPTLSTVQK
ncbi:unnamed protein product [Chironomus riparius]|uniref:Scavenger receptor class B member 1 n=1 Tax=Chironomus riparius TaxID=315576 RepID=A0A9N9S1C6_9DIPT|nr:unnamed protein product [Chironomus riparius]